MTETQKYNFEKTDTGLYLPKGTYSPDRNKLNWGAIAGMAGISIPIIGFLGYIIAFLYEIGYTSYYGLPMEIIQLDQPTILKSCGAALLLTLLFASTFLIWVLLQKSRVNGIWKFLAFINMFIIPSVLYFSIKGYIWGEKAVYVNIFIYLWEWVLLFKAKNTTNRPSKINKRPLIAYSFFSLIIVMALCGFAYISGSTDAINEQFYRIPSTNPNSIILRIYGTNAICAPLTTDNLAIKRSFFILKLDEQNLILSIREPKGHLGIVPENQSK